MVNALTSRTTLVAVGGLIGSVLRYWLAGIVQGANDGAAFPAGTLAVNVAGSFLIGLVMTLSLERGLVNDDVRILLTTGFCGGFTTMSTFSYETMALLRDGQAALAFGNLGGTIAGCCGAVWLGQLLARLL